MKERLLREGFPDWTRNDYHQFIRACEQLGRGDVAAIVHSVTVKTERAKRRCSGTMMCFGRSGGGSVDSRSERRKWRNSVVFSHELRRAKQSCHGRMEWNR